MFLKLNDWGWARGDEQAALKMWFLMFEKFLCEFSWGIFTLTYANANKT